MVVSEREFDSNACYTLHTRQTATSGKRQTTFLTGVFLQGSHSDKGFPSLTHPIKSEALLLSNDHYSLRMPSSECKNNISPLNTKRRLFYLKPQYVPRSKHFSSRL
jgi:hypothetical protein